MTDRMPLQGYSHIEFWVGNARQAAHYYRSAFGFTPIAYAGPETGVRDRASWVLEQGGIRFVLTAGLAPEHEVVRHHGRHGDGVRDVAFAVPDAAAAFARAVAGGAEPHVAPEARADEHGEVVVSAIRAYGETVHSFVQRAGYEGVFLPGYAPVEPAPAPAVGLERVDHVVANVERGRMEDWVRFYAEVRERLDWSGIDADLDVLAANDVLVDTDDEGYLLQIFSEQVQDRPTVFFEIIERCGARGFGEGNFKALFEAIERDQAARGNL